MKNLTGEEFWKKRYWLIAFLGIVVYLAIRQIDNLTEWWLLVLGLAAGRVIVSGLQKVVNLSNKLGDLSQAWKNLLNKRKVFNDLAEKDRAGFFPQVNTKSGKIEGVSIETLKNKFGSPLFVVSEKVLVSKINYLKDNIRASYGNNFELAYSIKTNNVLGICKIIKGQNVLAEVVSEYEYELATKKLGYAERQIIYNGPYKTESSLRSALKMGAKVNVDNFEELEAIVRLTKNWKSPVMLGLRIDPLKAAKASRFGFNIELKKANKALKIIKTQKNLDLVGIHSHIGSNILSVDEYYAAANKICRWIKKNKIESLSYLDFGGGFPVGGSSYQSTKGIKHYLLAITKPIKTAGLDNITLIIEPGRYIVDQSVILVTSVLSSEKTGKVNNITVDAPITSLPLALYRNQLVDLINNKQVSDSGHRLTSIYGSSCMETDVLAKNKMLNESKMGDSIIFYNAGAYNISQSSQFIFPRPGIVVIKKSRVEPLRRREKPNDLWRLDKR